MRRILADFHSETHLQHSQTSTCDSLISQNYTQCKSSSKAKKRHDHSKLTGHVFCLTYKNRLHPGLPHKHGMASSSSAED